MRSEAISSSRIEGIAPNVDKVGLAELAQEEEVRGFKEGAEEVAVTSPFCVPLRKALPPNRQSLSSFSKSFEESGWGRRALFPLDFALFKTGPVEVTTHPLGPSSSQRPPRLVRDLVEDLCLYLDGA